MEKEIYYNNLFDYYGELLNEKQQEYFKYYYFDNLSLSEIADNLNLSRNAIHKQLKQIEGGGITSAMINAISKGVNTLYELGRQLGSSLRRIISNSYCPTR